MRPELPERIKILLNHLCPDRADAIERLRVDNQVVLIVLNTMDKLSMREKAALDLRFGLTEHELSLAEIAVRLGREGKPNIPISEERVRQLVTKASRKMRHPLRSGKLFGLLEALSN